LLIVEQSRGGHWNDAYPYVKLHQPSSYYGVNSRPLGLGKIDQIGLNQGMHELATGAEVSAHFDAVMRERLLPSERVQYLPMHNYEDGVATNLLSGSQIKLTYRQKLVDCRNDGTSIPAKDPPKFEIDEGVRCIPLGELTALSERVDRYTIIGAGKTAMDAVVFLCEQGVDPDRIDWARPREPWILNRRFFQSGYEFFQEKIESAARELEEAAQATSLEGLYEQWERDKIFFRIDPTRAATMFRCPIVSEQELLHLRSVKNVIRLGHIKRIATDKIYFTDGEARCAPNTLHVHCSASGIPVVPKQPIFQDRKIVPQFVRRCQPTFSASVIAHLEAILDTDEAKNAAATPVPMATEPSDWLRFYLLDDKNMNAWREIDGMMEWLASIRLDPNTGTMLRAQEEAQPEMMAAISRVMAARGPAFERVRMLLGEA